MRESCFVSLVSAWAALSVWTMGSAYGQTATSAMNGTVQDQTGAVVPAADVVIANSSKGIERKLQTNEAGIFNAPALVPAPGYSLTVSKTGFAKYEVKDINLAVGQVVDLNIALGVAATGTEVSVTAEAPLV